MSMFVNYATPQDVAEYMGKESKDMPKGLEVLIKRASEMIHMAVKQNFNPNNDEHVEAVKLATCSQCQYWIETEVSPVSNNNVSSYSLGELTVTYSDVDKYSNKLCLSSVRYLHYKHLLYKGMR